MAWARQRGLNRSKCYAMQHEIKKTAPCSRRSDVVPQNHPQSPDPPRGEHNPSPGAQRASAVCQNKKVHAAKFRIGLVQMACSLDPNENLAKADRKSTRLN